MTAQNKRTFLMGFLGFLGFQGMSYFFGGAAHTLGYMAYFGFFAYFFIARIANNTKGERYEENMLRAKAVAFRVAVVETFLLCQVSALVSSITKEMVVAGATLCFVLLPVTYAAALYYYEER